MQKTQMKHKITTSDQLKNVDATFELYCKRSYYYSESQKQETKPSENHAHKAIHCSFTQHRRSKNKFGKVMQQKKIL